MWTQILVGSVDTALQGSLDHPDEARNRAVDPLPSDLVFHLVHEHQNASGQRPQILRLVLNRR